MVSRDSKRQTRCVRPARNAANDDVYPVTPGEADLPQPGSPANDNPSIHDLPTCLEVTDQEVGLLHQYLGRQILALFG